MNSDVAKQRGWRWTVRRVLRGGPLEAVWRVGHVLAVRRWNGRATRPIIDRSMLLHTAGFDAAASGAARQTPDTALADRARALRSGRAEILSAQRIDLTDPDWMTDAGAATQLGSDLDGARPNPSLKHQWELARLAVTVDLALDAALHAQPDSAEVAEQVLRGWSAALSDEGSMLWGSGVEAALRLLALDWTLGLLAAASDTHGDASGRDAGLHPVAEPLRAELAARIDRHLERLAKFPSRHSSANNHALVEAAGLLAGSVRFRPKGRASRWEAVGLSRLLRQLDRQLDGAGVSREQAADYHGFVTEVVALTVSAFDGAGRERPQPLLDALARLRGAVGALQSIGSPRVGDGDDSSVVGLDERSPLDRAAELADAVLLTPRDPAEPEPRSAAMIARSRAAQAGAQPVPWSIPDDAQLGAHSWAAPLRCGDARAVLRHGPLGYLAVAAHAHADLTSMTLDLDGRPVLIDPGTFAYDSHPAWRRFFRSTAAHNCLCLEGDDQAEYWGPFLWGSDATARLTMHDPRGVPAFASAVHDGYRRAGATVERSVRLSRSGLDIEDLVRPVESRRSGPWTGSMAFTFAAGFRAVPAEGVTLRVECSGGPALTLVPPAGWTAVIRCGEHGGGGHGWASPRFGQRIAVSTVIVSGSVDAGRPLHTSLTWQP